jgi:hypothetical protein
MQSSLETNSLFPFLTPEQNGQRQCKVLLLTAQFHIPGVTDEEIKGREKLHGVLAQNKIPGEEFEKKVVYLSLISNLTYLILSQFNKVQPLGQPLSKEELLEFAESWFTKNLSNYTPKSLSKISDADITTLAMHDSQHLKLLFETLLHNFWNSVLNVKRKNTTDPDKVFEEMQSLFKCCSNLLSGRDYVFNVLGSHLMQLFYQCKSQPVSDVEITITHQALTKKVEEKKEAREPERILGTTPKPTALLSEAIIFDMPKRKTVFDELRQDWAAKNKASAPLDEHGIFTADPNFKP